METSRFAIGDGTILSTRTRVVWTPDEKRQLDRVARIFNAHGDVFLMKCGHRTCPDRVIKLASDPTDPNGLILQCGCTDRIFVPLKKH